MILVFAAISGIFHILFFLLESVYFTNKNIYRLFGFSSAEMNVVKTIFLNQGFYNLFLAAGIFAGLYVYYRNQSPFLLLYVCLYMIAAALVLFVSKPRLIKAAFFQGFFPTVVLIMILNDLL